MLERDLKFDKRILDRNFKRGTATQEEYDAHLAGLEDVSGKASEVEVEVSDGEYAVDFPETLLEEEDEED